MEDWERWERARQAGHVVEFEAYTVHATGIAPDGLGGPYGVGPQFERRYFWFSEGPLGPKETSTGAVRIDGELVRGLPRTLESIDYRAREEEIRKSLHPEEEESEPMYIPEESEPFELGRVRYR